MPGVDSESGPSTRKQGHKSARDKASGAGRLGSGKGARALEANQARRGGAKAGGGSGGGGGGGAK